MKMMLCLIIASLGFSSLSGQAQDFKGAIPTPIGKIEQYSMYDQFQITFPAEMKKSDALKVTCLPEVAGTVSWANNNTVWTYNLKIEYPGIAGGTRCQVRQTESLSSRDGKIWEAGTIQYEVQILGPNVDQATPIYGFNGLLRESEAMVLVVFNGDIDQASFWANPNVYLNYTSGSAPAEKLKLEPLTAAQFVDVAAYAEEHHYIDTKKNNWVVGTVRQNLIPGSALQLNVGKVVSAYDSKIVSEENFTANFQVRSDFKAEVKCARPSEQSPVCLPLGAVAVEFNAKTKWADAQKLYLEYVPFKGKNKERVYPTMVESENSDYFDVVLDWLSTYIPVMAQFSETLVERVEFDVKFEPETVASVFIPQDIKDVDGRALRNTPEVFGLRIGSPQEVFRMPGQLSFFEKGVKNLAMPIGVVNLNQEISIRKLGQDSKSWASIQDMKKIIQVIRAYSNVQEFREEPNYTSPMQTLGLKNNTKTTRLGGEKNRSTYLTLPFAKSNQAPKSGLYAMEISSPSLEKDQSRDGLYLNPKHVLAQVTNLSVHVKKGKEQSLAFVTALDSGLPVANADIEVRNCLGDVVAKGKTNASGFATFVNKSDWATDCAINGGADDNSSYGQIESFFVVAKKADDFTFVHSSWNAENSWAMGAPGVEYYYSAISEGRPYFHAVVGVNLVKPGQKVPVQIFGKMPTASGYADVPANRLPKVARVYSYEDSELYYDFPLTWNQGAADFTWTVQSGSSAKLGQYAIKLLGDANAAEDYISNSDIEVAEFKVPLMSGSLQFPQGPLVKPTALPVNASVRYANGIGAKDLEMAISYYFSETTVAFSGFDDFKFGNGVLQKTDKIQLPETGLPSSERPAMVEELTTNADGSVTLDIAAEKTQKGISVGETLKDISKAQTLVARARYQDQMGEYQTLSQSAVLYTSSAYAGTQLIAGSRNEAKLNAAVVGANGEALNPQGDLELKVYKIETKVMGEELYGGLIRNTYEREISDVRWTQSCVNKNQTLSCEVGTLKAGNYAFEVKSASSQTASHVLFKIDSDGRVYGNDDYMGFGDEDSSKQLPLTLNKPSYELGDKAVVSFSAPFEKCTALITLERESVVRSFVSQDACAKGFVEIPVVETLAPNVFVSVYLLTGRTGEPLLGLGDLDLGKPTYRIGFANLKVELAEYQLNVEVATDKEVYKPRDTVTVTAKVSPELGSLKNATVTFVAIEEKILELKDNKTYNILDALMQLRDHQISTLTLLDMVASVSAKDPDGLFDPSPVMGERKDGDEGGDGSVGELRRRLFDALVKMDTKVPVVNGVATWQFQANDSLTKFKVFAIVSDASNKF
jgi:hypothetical protein